MDADVRTVLSSVYRTAQDRNVTFLAAAVAYHAFVSLIPLVLLAIVAGSLFGGERLATRLIEVTGDALPAAGEELLTDVLTTEAGRAEATLVSLVVATWGALKVFRGLNLAFDEVYDAVDETSLVEGIRNGITVVVAVAGAIALMVVLGAVIGVVADEVPYVGGLGWALLLVGLALVFLPIYYVLPPVPVRLGEALPGAVVAAAGWTVLQAGFQVYAANAGRYEAYGILGAVLLFVTWLYFAGVVVLLGAVLNVVLGRPAAAEGLQSTGRGE